MVSIYVRECSFRGSLAFCVIAVLSLRVLLTSSSRAKASHYIALITVSLVFLFPGLAVQPSPCLLETICWRRTVNICKVEKRTGVTRKKINHEQRYLMSCAAKFYFYCFLFVNFNDILGFCFLNEIV